MSPVESVCRAVNSRQLQQYGGVIVVALDGRSGDGQEWIFRRDPSLRIDWHDAVLRSDDDIPYLAPELQLLFKSRDARPKDDVDAHEVIPDLDDRRRQFLRQWLPQDHHWQRLL